MNYNIHSKQKMDEKDKQFLNFAGSIDSKKSTLSLLKEKGYLRTGEDNADADTDTDTFEMNFAKIVEHKKSVILLVNGFSKKDINNKIYITKSYDPNDYVTLDAIFKVFSKKDLSAYYKISHQLYLELVALKHK